MDDLQLQELVRSIQASTDRRVSVVRKQIDRLLTEVSIRLQPVKQAYIKQWSGLDDINSLVAESVQETILLAIKNIDKYEPEKAKFMTWINGIFRFKFSDVKDRHQRYQDVYKPTYIDKPISKDNSNSIARSKLEEKNQEAETAKAEELERDDLRAKLRKFIETDPESILKEHIKDKPDATFQKIMLMRLVPMAWQTIADRFDIASLQTVKSFHDRQLHKYNNNFRKYLQE